VLGSTCEQKEKTAILLCSCQLYVSLSVKARLVQIGYTLNLSDLSQVLTCNAVASHWST
jgi:hypothetical protein